MAVKTSWSAGDVLAAADLTDTFAAKMAYALPKNAQTGTTYTFVLADAGKLVTASNAASSTYTVPPQSSVTWVTDTVLRVTNLGAGTVTFAGGSGVTVTNTAATLAQYASANLIRTGSDAWTVVPFSGSSPLTAADISSTTGSPTTGSYTSGGIGYTYYEWTGDGTVVTSRGGYCEALIIGAGGGASYAGGGGGGQHLIVSEFWLPSGTTNIKVGAGGAGNAASASLNTANGGYSGLGDVRAIGGGYGRYLNSDTSFYAGSGASGGGIGISGTNPVAGASLLGAGNGATGGATSGGGGGGSGGNGTAGSSGTGGNGGAGTSNSITNTAIGRCGGGAGGGSTAGGTASDGGGAGSTTTGTAGAANKGGGGGGGWNNGGAAGGSGTVIIKVRT